MLDEREESQWLVDRLARLFDKIRPNENGPDGRPRQFTNPEVVRWIKDNHSDIRVSHQFLSMVRRGERKASDGLRDALCDFFNVPRKTLARQPKASNARKSEERLQMEIELANIARNHGVRNLALRALELTPEGLAAVASVLDAVLKDQPKNPGQRDR